MFGTYTNAQLGFPSATYSAAAASYPAAAAAAVASAHTPYDASAYLPFAAGYCGHPVQRADLAKFS